MRRQHHHVPECNCRNCGNIGCGDLWMGCSVPGAMGKRKECVEEMGNNAFVYIGKVKTAQMALGLAWEEE